MNFRHWLSGVLGVAVALHAVCSAADDRPGDGLLGPAEPIGTLLITVTVQDLPEAQLGQPILLASLEETTVEFAPAASADPAEIQQHLQRTSELLCAAGLNDDALAVAEILRSFESKHRDRLNLARKRAEVAKLQDEIAQLSFRLNEGIEGGQVVIDVVMFETDGIIAEALPVSWDHQEFTRWMRRQQSQKTVNILSRPRIRALSGQTAEVSSGQMGPNATDENSNVFPGICIKAIPTIISQNCVRVSLQSERTALIGGNKALPRTVIKHKVQSALELESGRAHIIKFDKTSDNDDKVTLIAVTGTSVESADSLNAPRESGRAESKVNPAGFSQPVRTPDE